MANYIEVVNSNNKIIINDVFDNYELVERISLREQQDFNDGFTHKDNNTLFINSAKNTARMRRWISPTSLIFYRSSNPVYAFASQRYSEDYVMIEIKRRDGRNISGCSQDVEMYIFDTKNDARGNIGLQIFNEDETCIFDSTRRYLRIIDCLASLRGEAATIQNANPFPSKSYSKPVMVSILENPWASNGDTWQRNYLSFPTVKSISNYSYRESIWGPQGYNSNYCVLVADATVI